MITVLWVLFALLILGINGYITATYLASKDYIAATGLTVITIIILYYIFLHLNF